MKKIEYAGFWIRFWAFVIDSLAFMVISIPIMFMFSNPYYKSTSINSDNMNFNSFSFSTTFSSNLFLNYMLPAIVILIFWFYKSATPGKMLFKLSIVDSISGDKPTMKQFILRYLGYFLSSFLFGLGFIWIAFDKRKQGLHDKIASTVVVREISNHDVEFK